MHASQYTRLYGQGVIILDKVDCNASISKFLFCVALREETSVVTIDSHLDDFDIL